MGAGDVRFLKLLSPSALALLVALISTGAAEAIPQNEVVLGARYSVEGIGENRTGIAVRWDGIGHRVLVVFDDNRRAEWVPTNRLIQSELGSFVNDLEEVVVWTEIAICLLSRECRQQEATAPHQSEFAGTSGELVIENTCEHPIDFRLHYQLPNEQWSTNTDAVWTINGASRALIVDENGDPIQVLEDQILFNSRTQNVGQIVDAYSGMSASMAMINGQAYQQTSIGLAQSGERILTIRCEN